MFIANEDPEPSTTPIQRFQSAMPRLLQDFALNADPRLKLKIDRLPSISSHKTEGPRRFAVRKVPWETIKTAYYLIDAVNPSAADRRSIFKQYQRFVDLNSDEAGAFYDDDEMLMLFTIDIMIQGIKASSAETYFCSVLSMADRRGEKIKGPLVKDTRKMLHMLRLDDEVDHAVDITEDIACAILRCLENEARAMCFFLIVTGARVADVLHLSPSMVTWHKDNVTVQFKCTKNRKNPNKVFTATYPYAVQPDICVAELERCMKAAKAQARGKLFSMEASDFNACVRTVWKAEWGDKVATSYSFRRLAIQRFVRQSMSQEDGKWVIKWARAMALTGHLRLETLRVRYLEVEMQTLEGAVIPDSVVHRGR